MQLNLMVGQPFEVGTVHHAFDRGLVDAVLDHRRFEGGAGHDRLPDHHMLPRQRQPVGTQANPRLMQERRAVIAATNVILPRPHGFHRPARCLGNLHRFSDKIRRRVGAPAKTAAQELGMDFHLLWFEPGDFPGDHLIEGLELGASPDFALVLGDLHRAVQRFHGRMREVRHAVLDIEGLARLGQRRLGVAGLTGRKARRGGEFAEALQQFLAVQTSVRPQIPLDRQRVTPQLGRPIMIGNHRHARRHLQHFVHPRDRQRAGAFEGFDAAAKYRRPGDHRGHQAVELHVHAELRAPGDFFRGVQAFGGFADEFPVLGVLELDQCRIRHWQLAGIVGQFAVAGALVAGNDHPRVRTDLRRRHVETLGRGLDHHQACRRTGLAIAVELHPGRSRAAGDLHPAKPGQPIILGRGRGMFDADFGPVGIQLFGNQQGQAGPDTLAHFRMAEQHSDAVVIADAQERIRREHIALVVRTLGKPMGTRDDKRHHQAAAQRRGALEETTTR